MNAKGDRRDFIRSALVGAGVYVGSNLSLNESPAADAQFKDGIWTIDLTPDDVGSLPKKGAVVIAAIKDPTVAVVVGAGVAAITLVNKVGGNKGVKIAGCPFLPVTATLPACEQVDHVVEVVRGRFHEAAKVLKEVIDVTDGLPGIPPVPQIQRELIKALFGGGDPPPKFGRIERRDEAREWERFTLEFSQEGKVALRFQSGYLCAENGGGSHVIADRQIPQGWEMWTLVEHEDRTVSLQAENGDWLCAQPRSEDPKVDQPLVANRKEVQGWEKFRVEPSAGSLTLRSHHGWYVCAVPQ